MTLTQYKQYLVRYWERGYYTVWQMRHKMTTQNGTNRAFSFEEFEYVVGITIEEYDNNEEFFQDMKYADIQEYLSSKENAEEDNNEL